MNTQDGLQALKDGATVVIDRPEGDIRVAATLKSDDEIKHFIIENDSPAMKDSRKEFSQKNILRLLSRADYEVIE